jgi:ABC-type transport system substrate-binding protein
MRLIALVVLACAAWSIQAADAATLRVGAQSLPPMRGNPYQPITLPSALIAQMVFDPLISVGPGGEAQPALAISWHAESPTVWVLRLRPGVRFSDDTAFDAAAVVAAFDYLRTDEGRRDSVASMDVKASIERVEAREPLIVAITTRKPDPVLPLHLNFVRVPSPTQWTALGHERFARAPVGTGPFRVTDWQDNRVRLTAHRASWRAPIVDDLDVMAIPDPSARLQALISDAVDIALGVAPEDKAAIEVAGGRLVSRPMPLLHFLAFVTTKDTPLKDRRVRMALNHAVDTKAIIAAFLDNAVTPATQFSHAGAFGFDAGLQPYAFDPERARALLREAGYANGFSFSAVLDGTSGGNYVDWYQRIAQDFNAIGVTMTLRMSTSVQMIQSVQTGVWANDAFAWSFAGFDSLRGYRFRSCAWSTPYHCDPTMMPLIAAAEAAASPADRQQRTQTVLAAEAGDPPGLMLWRGVTFDGLGPGIADFAAENDVIRWDRVGRR